MTSIELKSSRVKAVTLLSVTCLDAPLVAITWQQLFASSWQVQLMPAARIALFAAAWLIYLADRFGDSFTIGKGTTLSLRQRFVMQHRGAFVVTMGIAAAAGVATVPYLTGSNLIAGGFIACGSVIYLAANHFFDRIWRVLPIKEISIGTLFAVGTSAATGGAAAHSAIILWFGVLCALNCISIAVWERDLDLEQQRISIATVAPRIREFCLAALVALFVATGILALFRDERVTLLCIAISAMFLGSLHFAPGGISRDERTALADLVLLTPIFAILFM